MSPTLCSGQIHAELGLRKLAGGGSLPELSLVISIIDLGQKIADPHVLTLFNRLGNDLSQDFCAYRDVFVASHYVAGPRQDHAWLTTSIRFHHYRLHRLRAANRSPIHFIGAACRCCCCEKNHCQQNTWPPLPS